MTSLSYNKFNCFVQDVANKVHNLSSDTFKLMLTNTAPIVTNAVYADVSATELASGNGYATGGAVMTVVSSLQTSGIEKWIASMATPTWVASGSMGPFEYFILYNSSPASKPLIAWFDYGSAITLGLLQPFTVAPDLVNGILQIQ
jgi:hypothetical protein